MKFFVTPIQPSFEYDGNLLELAKDYGNYKLYSVTRKKDNRLIGYEIVKPVKHTNPDGTEILRYPQTAEWGKKGWSYPATADFAWIEQRMRSRFPDFPLKE